MVEQIIQIKGTPLLKFQCKDKIEQLQQGKVYMKSLKWYRDNVKLSDAVGDDYEAMLHMNQATMIVRPLEGGSPIAIQEITDGLLATIHSNDYVFCMFSINPNIEEFQFSDEQQKKMLNFGDTALIITDPDEFYTRVRAALITANIELNNAYCGFVKYYDESVDAIDIFRSLMEGLHNVAFQKRNKYSYQQEYRFLIPNNGRIEDYFEIQIGNISDISEIVSTKTALNGTLCKTPKIKEATFNE